MKDLKLEHLFLEQLKDFYGAEIHIAAFLPKMVAAAHSGKLKNVLSNHLQMTRNQVNLLEKVFEYFGENPGGGQAGPAVQGLMQEAENIAADPATGDLVRDAALIIAAQKIHHYEMASYGGLVTLAGEIGDQETADLLRTAESHAPLSALDLK